MLRIAVCDDMPDVLQQARLYIEDWAKRPDFVHVETFNNADSLLTHHRANPFDIIFLDVVMPLLNGLEAAREIRQQANYIPVRTATAVHRVLLQDIESIEAYKKRALLSLADGSTMESIAPLHFFEDKLLLEDGFFRCHRCYVINLHCIKIFFAV